MNGMNMKQMPYGIPDGFIEMSKIRNRAAVRRAAAGKKRIRAAVRWAVPAMATLALVVAGAVVYVGRDDRDDMKRLMAQMRTAPDEVVYDMSVEAVDYADDWSLF